MSAKTTSLLKSINHEMTVEAMAYYMYVQAILIIEQYPSNNFLTKVKTEFIKHAKEELHHLHLLQTLSTKLKPKRSIDVDKIKLLDRKSVV